ncbi:MAG: alpha/beta hydrolase [Oscillospiraceae bacterium]
MVIQWKLTIPELSGRTKRRAYVYVPDEAEENPEARYPVLYMFDGHNVFFDSDATYGKSWGMADYMDATGTPLIIAAVECSHKPNNGRLSEYSPFTFDDPAFGHVQGRGRSTMNWLVNVFKPYVDEHFPTIPDRAFTFIAGSSMGGLMSLYAISQYNHVFSRAAALSPSVWVTPGRLDRMLRSSHMEPDTVIYMDYGSEELRNHGEMKQHFSRVVNRLLKKDVFLTSRIVPYGEHCEASWEKQIPVFMETLLYGLDE